MGKIAESIHRSPFTVMNHIKAHNKEVQKRGACEVCKRVHSRYAKEVV